LNPAYISAFGRSGGRDYWWPDVVRDLMVHAADAASEHQSPSPEGKAGGAVHNEYISVAAGLYVDALTDQTEDPSKMVPPYALGSWVQGGLVEIGVGFGPQLHNRRRRLLPPYRASLLLGAGFGPLSLGLRGLGRWG
jgi:hypothetical protein